MILENIILLHLIITTSTLMIVWYEIKQKTILQCYSHLRNHIFANIQIHTNYTYIYIHIKTIWSIAVDLDIQDYAYTQSLNKYFKNSYTMLYGSLYKSSKCIYIVHIFSSLKTRRGRNRPFLSLVMQRV